MADSKLIARARVSQHKIIRITLGGQTKCHNLTKITLECMTMAFTGRFSRICYRGGYDSNPSSVFCYNWFRHQWSLHIESSVRVLGVSSWQQLIHFFDFFKNMLNITSIILFFFIHTLTHYIILYTYSHSLCNYSVSTLSRGFFCYMQ